MKRTKIIMGMPVTVEIIGSSVTDEIFKTVFGYFAYIDETFSTYKSQSEIMHINRGELHEADWSDDMQTVFELASAAREKTDGYFDIQKPDGSYDPSGVVKGWSIQNAATIIKNAGFENFYIDAGGDIQTAGVNAEGVPWKVGIKNPFNEQEVVKVVQARDTDFFLKSASGQNFAIATSGTYIRGRHIYNPKTGAPADDDMVSITVVGDNICDVDLVATAAFAMGDRGVRFIEDMPGFEAYAIDKNGMATMTSGFQRYVS
jgi:FAD:protein FMN transferase